MTDPDWRVMSRNAGAAHIFRYEQDEILGEPISQIFTPEDVEHCKLRQELSRALAQDHAGDERWHVRKDDTRFWASGVVTRLWDESGKLRGFAKVACDIIERKWAEAALRSSEERAQRELLELQ